MSWKDFYFALRLMYEITQAKDNSIVRISLCLQLFNPYNTNKTQHVDTKFRKYCIYFVGKKRMKTAFIFGNIWTSSQPLIAFEGAAFLLLQSLVVVCRSPPTAAAANKAIDGLIWAPFPFWCFLMLNTAAINKLPAFLSLCLRTPPLLARRHRRHLLELI